MAKHIEEKNKKFKLTEEQIKAIETTDKNILVFAGAGSGKTSVLSKRIIKRIIDEGLSIDDFLVVTFTDNAAFEMKQRIRKNLLENIPNYKNTNKYNHIKDEALKVSQSNISTLHTFCLKVIKENSQLVDNIDINATIIDETKEKIYKEEILDDILESEFGKEDDDFTRLIYTTDKSYKTTNLKRIINEIYGKVNAFPNIEEKINQYKKLYECKDIESLHKSIITNNLFSTDEDLQLEKILKDIIKSKNIVYKLLDLILLLDTEYTEKKNRENVIDFSDMEHIAYRLLKDTKNGVSNYYKSLFKEIYVDEFQDVSVIQDEILSFLKSESNTFFIVGDVKQSIYGFRNASPNIINQKLDVYSKSKDCKAIFLNNNFRSRKEIIDGINQVFEYAMDRQNGFSLVTYDDNHKLLPGKLSKNNEDNRIEVNVIEGIKNKDNNDLEIDCIIQKIRQLYNNFEIKDNKTDENRKATYKDISIIVRDNNLLNKIKKRLKEEEISYTISKQDNYFLVPEIRNILNLLKIIDNPINNIELASVLTSPFIRLTVEDLSIIKRDNLDLYQSLIDYSQSNNDEIKKKIDYLFYLIDKYNKRAQFVSIYKLILEILDETNYMCYIKLNPNAKVQLANINMLIEKASNYENDNYKSIYGFIRYINHIIKYQISEKTSQDNEDEIDAIKLMTIHSSKGLESPIVILPFLNKSFRSIKGQIIFDKEFGIATDIVDNIKKIKIDSCYKEMLKEKVKLRDKDEELRILYVAMTRAREKLILFANIPDKSKGNKSVSPGEKWKAMKERDLSNKDIIKEFNSYIEFIAPVINKNKLFIENYLTPSLSKKIVDDKDKSSSLCEIIDKNITKEKVDDAIIEQLKKDIIFTYKNDLDDDIKKKYSVSSIKTMSLEGAENNYKVNNSNAKGGVNVGTAYHKVLEKIDFTNYGNDIKKSLLEDLDRLKEERIITEEILQNIDIAKIEKFINSDIACKIKDASKNNKIYKEQRFMAVLNKRDSEYLANIKDENIIIQGIVDLYFVDNDELYLIDYKTDHIKDKDALINRHKVQLDIYAAALSKSNGIDKVNKYIYSIEMDEFIEVK